MIQQLTFLRTSIHRNKIINNKTTNLWTTIKILLNIFKTKKGTINHNTQTTGQAVQMVRHLVPLNKFLDLSKIMQIQLHISKRINIIQVTIRVDKLEMAQLNNIKVIWEVMKVIDQGKTMMIALDLIQAGEKAISYKNPQQTVTMMLMIIVMTTAMRPIEQIRDIKKNLNHS